MDDTQNDHSANPAYVLNELAKVLAASQEHADPSARERAKQKVQNWFKVLQGMLSGQLQIGSRTPVSGTPGWVTLEVIRGGFATGELLAGGSLQSHEQELLARLPAVAPGAERAALNSFHLSEPGFAELRGMLQSGCYRINLPEEGALLALAWLLEYGHAEQARALLDEIGPFASRLRFYPVPAAKPLPDDQRNVHLLSIAQVIQELRAVRVPDEVLRQRESIRLWIPLRDRLVDRFVETIEGSVPTLRTGPDGKPERSSAGQFAIDGGWPCQHYPDGWQARARSALDDYKRLRAEHKLSRDPERQTGNLARLLAYLEKCVSDPRALTGRDVGMIRWIIASINTRRGLPGTPCCRQVREAQTRQIANPTSVQVAGVLIERLAALPQDDGLASVQAMLSPVSADEAARHGLKLGQILPASWGDRLVRAWKAPVEALIEKGIIPSGEILARVVPQISGYVLASRIPDTDLRRLYNALYSAFRRRRSLLLLNLANQIKFQDLPSVKAFEAHRTSDLSSRETAWQTLVQVVTLAVTSFPQQILPNKLLQEIRALAEGAGLKIPIVDEVAADIFMGTFSEKYLRAAQQAGELLAGTLYERYYGIPYARVRRIDDVTPSPFGTGTSAAFIGLCHTLAGDTLSGRSGPARWSVARNGKLVEQEQILTTHNLAPLFTALGLVDALKPRLEELARRCLEWICVRQQQPMPLYESRLRAVKNSAYAWRQMIFFLALLPADDVSRFRTWAEEHLTRQSPDFQNQFRPALDGLKHAVAGGSPEDQPGTESAAPSRRFLGWTTEKHWLFV
jgi:hypothetical protein